MKGYDGKFTKSEFNKKIKKMKFKELQDLYNDLTIQIQKGDMERSKGQNPYEKGKLPMKILKWKRVQVMNQMNMKTI